jgi:hypothetical protein
MKITITSDEQQEVTAKTVHITAKCSDLCITRIKDENDRVLKEHDGYVPDFMPGDHYGDYVILDIDLDTGKILNWDATRESVEATLEKWGE